MTATAATADDAPSTMEVGAPEGRALYYPETFEIIAEDAVETIQEGLKRGLTMMEVDFPLSSDTSGYKDSSDIFIDVNIQLAIRAAGKLAEDGKSVRVLVPDAPELNRASKRFQRALEFAGGAVTLGCLTSAKKGMLGGLFGGADSPSVEEQANADMYIIVNCSTVDLPNVIAYKETVAGDKPIVTWCMELDTLRADLGLFGFPSKDVHFKFLCNITPVFYLRQRAYSKSVPIAPFVVNYNGALFRTYPSGWQVMLKQDSGELACVAERPKRYTLNEVKEVLLDVVGLNTEEKGSSMEFLRRGFKRATWWEDEDGESKEESSAWRY